MQKVASKTLEFPVWWKEPSIFTGSSLDHTWWSMFIKWLIVGHYIIYIKELTLETSLSSYKDSPYDYKVRTWTQEVSGEVKLSLSDG